MANSHLKSNFNRQIDISFARILIVDDKPIHIHSMYQILSPFYTILAATNGKEAIERAEQEQPDLILLDAIMPEPSGIQVCKTLKENALTKNIPIIFVTSFQLLEEENECWEAGGIDFISKPVNAITLLNRVKAQLTLKFQTDLLVQLAYIDGLTGINNRRYLDEQLGALLAQAKRLQLDLAILMLDIDYFKQYNDTYGHISGDEALISIAQITQHALLRPADFVCRYGGEEFIVILPDTNLEGACNIAQRICDNLKEHKIEHRTAPLKELTLSMGCTTALTENCFNVELVQRADHLLYQAKQHGRNRIEAPKRHK